MGPLTNVGPSRPVTPHDRRRPARCPMRVLLPPSILLIPVCALAGGPDLEKSARQCREHKWDGCVKLMDTARGSADKGARSAAIDALAERELVDRIAAGAGLPI